MRQRRRGLRFVRPATSRLPGQPLPLLREAGAAGLQAELEEVLQELLPGDRPHRMLRLCHVADLPRSVDDDGNEHNSERHDDDHSR